MSDTEHGTTAQYTLGCRCDECREWRNAYQRKTVAKHGKEETPSHLHGTLNAYSNYSCRCAECREVWAANVRRLQTLRSSRPVPDHVHGTTNGYGNYKCRCQPCTDAWTTASVAQARRRRERRAA